MTITSIHTLIYSDDAPATRVFLRDVLGWPYVEDAAGGGEGWLIFKSGRSEMGVHPTSSVYDGNIDFYQYPWLSLGAYVVTGVDASNGDLFEGNGTVELLIEADVSS